MCFMCQNTGNPANHIDLGGAEAKGAFGGYGLAAAQSINTAQYINTILAGYSWSASAGTAATVSYSFDYSAADRAIIYSNSPFSFSASEKEAAKLAMSDISKSVGITFVEAASSSAANIHFYNGDLTLGPTTVGVAGYYYDSNNVFTHASVGMDDSATNPSKGNDDYWTLLHEIGHAIGLKHAGNYNGAETGPFLPSNLDNSDYTVMAYDAGGDGSPTTMRALDIAALQYLYGSSSASTVSGGSGTTGTSGNDSLFGSATADDIKGGLGSDLIVGDSGNDTLYGGRAIADANDSADTIRGSAGDDLIYGNTGNDVLYGGDAATSTGDGADTIYGGLGSDSIYGNEGNDFLAGGGGIAHPADDADNIYGGGGNDSIIGNGGNDWIYGDATSAASTDGADTVYGGIGDDVIYGGGGNDVLYGQNGSDYLTGGSGADVFVLTSNGDVDTLYDFTSGSDLLRIASNINNSGITTAAQIIANFTAVEGWGVITLGNSSNAVWLQGVSSISASDIQFF